MQKIGKTVADSVLSINKYRNYYHLYSTKLHNLTTHNCLLNKIN